MHLLNATSETTFRWQLCWFETAVTWAHPDQILGNGVEIENIAFDTCKKSTVTKESGTKTRQTGRLLLSCTYPSYWASRNHNILGHTSTTSRNILVFVLNFLGETVQIHYWYVINWDVQLNKTIGTGICPNATVPFIMNHQRQTIMCDIFIGTNSYNVYL